MPIGDVPARLLRATWPWVDPCPRRWPEDGCPFRDRSLVSWYRLVGQHLTHFRAGLAKFPVPEIGCDMQIDLEQAQASVSDPEVPVARLTTQGEPVACPALDLRHPFVLGDFLWTQGALAVLQRRAPREAA